jgi:hypothetical protein
MKRYQNLLWAAAISLSCLFPQLSYADETTSAEYEISGDQLSDEEVSLDASLEQKKHESQSAGPRVHDSSLSPWIYKKDNVFVYKFNVFNLSPDDIDQKTLKSILKANKKDIHESFRRDWGTDADIRLYTAADLSNPDLFNGDRIPLFIVNNALSLIGPFLGFHAVEASEPANSAFFFTFNGNSIASNLAITVPSNFPFFTPYGAVDTTAIAARAQFNLDHNNPNGIQDNLQLLSFVINHELKEIMTDDSLQNWDVFDTFAPTVANWHYAVFDANGVCTNGTLGPDGFVHLPLFLDVFPAGGLLTTIQENGDPVSLSKASAVNAYKVGHWTMTNYPTSNFWKGYYVTGKIKWDKLGNVEFPLQPFAGLHEVLFFLNFGNGLTQTGEVTNWGPVTAAQRGDPPANNFPPDYTFVDFFFTFNPGPPAQFKSNLLQKNLMNQRSPKKVFK